jgi:hypothetical protein
VTQEEIWQVEHESKILISSGNTYRESLQDIEQGLLERDWFRYRGLDMEDFQFVSFGS